MRVLHWSKKFTIGEKDKKQKESTLKGKRLRKSVSTISKLFKSTSLRSLKRSSSKNSGQNGSAVLLPLTIKLDSESSEKMRRLRPRSNTLCDRSEMRSILQQRFTQRIMERSIAAVILEAKQELQKEEKEARWSPKSTSVEEQEDVYVPCEFSSVLQHKRSLKKVKNFEEDFYMTMSWSSVKMKDFMKI